MKTLAIVILNYNGKKHLQTYLPSVVECSDGHDILVIDNGSLDDSIHYISLTFPTVQLIQLKKNVGFAQGYNDGLARIKGMYEHYLLLNSDVEVTPDWIEPVVDLLEKNPNAAAAQPKILSYADKTSFEYAGAAGGFIDFLGYPFCRGRIFDTIEKDYGQYEKETEIFWASGAALFIKKDAWLEADGFDESLFAHMEEIDLCWRLKRLGKQIWYCPAASVYHVGGGTLSAESPHKTFLNFRNNLLMLYKNLPKNKRIYIIVLRFFLDFMSLIRFLVDKKSSNAWAISRAHVDFLKRVWKKEANGLELDGTFNALGLFPRSIVWQYFVRKQKTYKQL